MESEISPENLLALCNFAALGGSCIAPRPGSNTLVAVEFGAPGKIVVTGRQMEALHRAGYLKSRPSDRLRVLADDDVLGEVKADHEWRVSAAGWIEVDKALDRT